MAETDERFTGAANPVSNSKEGIKGKHAQEIKKCLELLNLKKTSNKTTDKFQRGMPCHVSDLFDNTTKSRHNLKFLNCTQLRRKQDHG